MKKGASSKKPNKRDDSVLVRDLRSIKDPKGGDAASKNKSQTKNAEAVRGLL